MRAYLLALFTLFFICGLGTLPSVATAAPDTSCSRTVYGGVHSGYIFQDIALTATEKPVFQGGFSLTCGKMTYDVWTSTELSDEGTYGSRGYGDEIDFTVVRNDKVGSFLVESSAAYFVAADFGIMEDDFGQVYVDVSRAFTVGSVTVAPFVRPMRWIMLADVDDTNLIRGGVRFSAPINNDWSVHGDVSDTVNLNDDLGTVRGELSFSRTFTKATVTFGGKFTENKDPIWFVTTSRTF